MKSDLHLQLASIVFHFWNKKKSQQKKHESKEWNLIRFHDLYLQKVVIIVTF